MSTNVASVTKHFPKAQNGFQTTLASTISSGAVTVPLNSVAGYTNGDTVVLIVDPADAAKKQTFTGVVDTAGVQITGVIWTAGTNVTHTGGATVVDYATATHISMVSKGILLHANQDGSLIGSAVRTALGETATTGAGYTALGSAPNTVTALGNRSYSLVFNTTDLTGSVSNGMRLRTTRTVAAPTQCTSLNGTTQFYSKTAPAGMTFTNNFVVSAWVKLTSYPGSLGAIASRYDGTSGWTLHILSDGRIQLAGYNAGAANVSSIQSFQSVPLNKWVHIAAQLDMATFTATPTTSYVMVDGVDVPANVSRGGTNPTALVQSGNLNIGAENSTAFFPGKIAQIAIYSAKVTEATILASMNQKLVGTETSLISAYSFDNSINDLNANANNLTANGSAVATNADSPFGGQADGTISSTLDYAIVTKTAFSTNTTLTVQVPEGCTIPTSGGVSALSYASVKAPYGMPVQRGKWTLLTLHRAASSAAGSVQNTFYNVGSLSLTIPIGEWRTGYVVTIYGDRGTVGDIWLTSTLSTLTSAETDTEFSDESSIGASLPTNVLFRANHRREKDISLAAVTPYYYLASRRDGGASNLQLNNTASGGASKITAELAYL